MTEEEARKVLVGTVVMWDTDPDDLGTVKEFHHNGFFVEWKNGQSGWIDYQDAERVSILQVE